MARRALALSIALGAAGMAMMIGLAAHAQADDPATLRLTAAALSAQLTAVVREANRIESERAQATRQAAEATRTIVALTVQADQARLRATATADALIAEATRLALQAQATATAAVAQAQATRQAAAARQATEAAQAQATRQAARLADEAEAARLAGQAEATRQAAERTLRIEATRLALQTQATRQAAEAEATRQAAALSATREAEQQQRTARNLQIADLLPLVVAAALLLIAVIGPLIDALFALARAITRRKTTVVQIVEDKRDEP